MNGKARLLLIQKILLERTDENHSISISEIATLLKKEYGFTSPDRITITDDIQALQNSGMEIEVERSTQNRYRYVDRAFDRAELKLMIDAVKSSKFITKTKSNELAEKIARLAGPDSEGLIRHTEVENRIRNGNKKLFLIIDVLHRAIEEKRQISFLYFRYNEKKEQILLHDGKPYRFNPAFLVWTGEYYYLAGTYANHPETVASFRIDRILNQPVILETVSDPLPPGFSPEQYINGTIHMFGSVDKTQETVKLLCDNTTASGIIDRFGIDTTMEPYDRQHFVATVHIAPTSVFYGWVFGFGGKVRILEPQEVANEFSKMLEQVRKEAIDG